MNIDLQAREIKPLRHTFAKVAQYVGDDKPGSRYQEATFGGQAETNFHYRPTWDPDHELYDASRTAIVLADWNVLKDPRQFYYANWTMTRARQQDTMEANFQFAEDRGLIGRMSDELRQLTLDVMLPLRHAAWGANMNNASICAYGWGTTFTAPAMFHAMDNLAIAQYLTRMGLAFDDPSVLEEGKKAWLEGAAWQGLRRYVEDTFVVSDPVELFVAQNLALDGMLYPLIYGAFVDDHVSLNGGTAVAMVTAFMSEWHSESARWVDAVMKAAGAESDANRSLLAQWLEKWSVRAHTALEPVARLALGDTGAGELADVCVRLSERCAKLGLPGVVA